MNTMSSCTIKTKTKTCNEMRILSCGRNVTEVLSDRQSFFVFPSGGKQNNAITGICKHLGARTHTHIHVTSSFSTSSHNPPFSTPFTKFKYLPRPPILPRFSRPLIRHPLHRTAQNHGYSAVAEYSSAAISSPGLCARSPEKNGKGQKI
jgi:hypothetical protein